MYQASACLVFIIGFSIPLSALMVAVAPRLPVRPVAHCGDVGPGERSRVGLPAAGCHAYDTAAIDLLTHALAVAVVIALNAALSGRLLSKA